MSNIRKIFQERAIPSHGGAQFLVTVLIMQYLIGRYGRTMTTRHILGINKAIKHLGEKM